jgi:hypothetical protein
MFEAKFFEVIKISKMALKLFQALSVDIKWVIVGREKKYQIDNDKIV